MPRIQFVYTNRGGERKFSATREVDVPLMPTIGMQFVDERGNEFEVMVPRYDLRIPHDQHQLRVVLRSHHLRTNIGRDALDHRKWRIETLP